MRKRDILLLILGCFLIGIIVVETYFLLDRNRIIREWKIKRNSMLDVNSSYDMIVKEINDLGINLTDVDDSKKELEQDVLDNRKEYESLLTKKEELTRKVSELEEKKRIEMEEQERKRREEEERKRQEEIERKQREEAERQKQIEENSKVVINGVGTYYQYPMYPTGCEIASLYILLHFYGSNVEMEELADNLEKGVIPYPTDGVYYGSNPEKVFVGDPRDVASFGAYNKPIKNLANRYRGGVVSEVGMSFDRVLALVSEGRPVMVWATIGLRKPSRDVFWFEMDTNERIDWISGEHAMVVMGYSNKTVIASDPYTGTVRTFDRNLFVSRYNYMGRRAIYY